VLVKAIEDTALGLASVYRSLDLPLPRQLPYASKDIRMAWMDLVARVMPFDLVIDEHTADGMEARVSKTSVAGSWGAVAGGLRFFADRFGVARASIEGTTLPYDLVGSYAVVGQPRIVLTGPRKHQRLALERRRRYFGFELDTEVEPLNGRIPEGLRGDARDLLADLLVQGEVVHPDAGRLKRAVAELDELWRRSGGTLPDLAPQALRNRVREQLEGLESWDDFMRTRIVLDPTGLIDQASRERLTALPGMVRVRGDAVPVDYELRNGEAVARIRLREGQAKRLRLDEVPVLDRPIRFAVQRGRHPPLAVDTLPELQALLRKGPRHDQDERADTRETGGRGRGRGRRGKARRTRNSRPGRRR
jgi:hypothetical protein